PVVAYDLAQFATEPPSKFMRLSHSRIPWYIDVYPQNAVGVTLIDLFSTMHGCLYQRIEEIDFENTEMGEEDRAKITASRRERVGGSKEEVEQGIDFLRRDCIFLGLKGTDKEGVYEMRTRKA
ncbi:uncharacterized protein STEHIDRAFT_52681, partial [Stereum hirsutum FP-91666 SS1]|uniref:uncharacterized protein n=1 Tax=Stereum hirsutum (strain FP-91666) TaxID=721885 RepID=UPI000440D2A5